MNVGLTSTLSLNNALLASASTAVNTGTQTAFYTSSPQLSLGEESTTLYAADPQFEHLGKRSMWDNAGLDRRIHSAHRNLVTMATAPLYLDTQLKHATRDHQGKRIGLQIQGDVSDTPSDYESESLETVLDNHPKLPVEGFDRGNHSSGNFFGVFNLRSRLNKWVRKWIFGDRVDTFEEQLNEAAGGAKHVLTPKKTFETMHRILHRHRDDRGQVVERINTAVQKADYNGYRLNNGEQGQFTATSLNENFHTFWHSSKGTKLATPSESPYWDCLVNYQVADLDAGERGTKVTPFYIQASQDARFKLEDGREVPVYSISIDTSDTDNPFVVFPGMSALQVRLIETFIDYVRQHQPEARFKLSAHFPAARIIQQPKGILGRVWSWINPFVDRKVRRAFKRLLSREEIIFFNSAHTHDREVNDLTKRLGLKRKTPLPEVVVPSLTDYEPVQPKGQERPQDGRALAIERIWTEKNPDGTHELKVDVDFKGVDPEDLRDRGLTSEVEAALAPYRQDGKHSYQRTLDTMSEKFGRPRWLGFGGQFGRQLWKNFFKKRAKSVFRFIHTAVLPLPLLWVPFFWKRLKNYWWEHPSIIQDIKDSLTTVATEQMFNEAEHLLPFLHSLTRFVEKDVEAGHIASEAILLGLREISRDLNAQLEARRYTFNAAVAAGEDAARLATFNDLLETSRVFRLPSLLVGLKEDSEARAFAVMVGLEASEVEYKFQGLKPTTVPNDALNFTVPLG